MSRLAACVLALVVAAEISMAMAASAAAPASAPKAEPAVEVPRLGIAIVVQDQTPLRATARESAAPHTLLWQGEALEVRGEKLDHLHVYDYRRERGGFVPASYVRRYRLAPAETAEFLAVMRFLRDTPGSEALGLGYSAAFIAAAPPAKLGDAEGAEALELLGRFAERLAARASGTPPATKDGQARLSAHLDVAARYGVQLVTLETQGRVRLCYEGDAYRRVLGHGAASESHRAHAALAVTRADCILDGRIIERREGDAWRMKVLESIDAGALPAPLAQRVRLRRASLSAALAFQMALRGESPREAADGALAELASIRKPDLAETDVRAYDAVALRVAASRWGALPVPPRAEPGVRPGFVIVHGQSGETCVALVDAKHDAARPLARRCTYGHAWLASASENREGNAAAIAVQPVEGWRELWIFTRSGDRWTTRVLPPATIQPGVGYCELAGWLPAGAQMLVAREALGDGRYERSFEVVRLDTLATVRKASAPGSLSAFNKWQDPSWKRMTLSLR